jgi:aspartyl-tRNA(Asn)/glutamyl-tRNA(Gln) amidotransferase subunit B
MEKMLEEKYEPIIGLEVHAQLRTKTKLFCSCPADYFELPPNQNVCPVCLGLPGTLPVLNEQAVIMAIAVGLALKSEISAVTKWDRKNYFYPDLPKGYQISQYDLPIAKGGYLEFYTGGELKKVHIIRAHLEEDTGRLLHSAEEMEYSSSSFVDLNRAGVPLMEIVSAPEIHSAEEARDYMMALRRLLRFLGVSDGDMEKGSLRCDANVSVRRVGNTIPGVKVEIKNMNSFRAVQRALQYEIERQVEVLENGGEIIQETRGWSEQSQITVAQRSKEYAHDYRYFPEPDLPPLEINQELMENARKYVGELPADLARRFVDELGLNVQEAVQLTESPQVVRLFLDIYNDTKDARNALTWALEVGAPKIRTLAFDEPLPFRNHDVVGLAKLVLEGKLSFTQAKTAFEKAWQLKESPLTIVQREGMVQISDEAEVEKLVDLVIRENQKAVADYANGKDRALDALVAAIMKASKGKANPKLASELLRKKIRG